MIDRFSHVYNRGVEKRKIFLIEEDYFRGVHDLYEMNDAKAILNINRKFLKDPNVRDPTSIITKRPRELLINFISWVLMPNHYHHFSYPRIKDGLSKFQQKFGVGYTGYFNIKYKRSGVLFQGGHKKVYVTDDAQAAHLICYIHANPLDLWRLNWREKGLTDFELQNALEFLEKKYRWSSHLDYWGIKNFPSLINTEFLEKFFGGSEGYRKFFINWLKQYEKNIKIIQKLTLE